jgi:hypothetical protein
MVPVNEDDIQNTSCLMNTERLLCNIFKVFLVLRVITVVLGPVKNTWKMVSICQRMYELFLQQRQRAAKDDTVTVGTFKEPVSKAMYSHIFNTEFNIAFHVPKSDRCDICEAYAKSVTKTDEENSANALHVNRNRHVKKRGTKTDK